MNRKRNIVVVALIAGLVSVSYTFFKTVAAGDFVLVNTSPAVESE